MKIIIGLGNPGPKYKNTWHNVGFLVLEELQKNLGTENFKANPKLKAEISTGKLKGEKIILAQPQTFMNLSGEAVGAILHYFKAKIEDLIVIHDDIDLALGKIRLAKNSSAGGHNGIKSIIENLKTQDFLRLKIGVKTARLEKMETADFVLEKFGDQAKTIKTEIKKAASAIETAISGSVERAMNEFN